MTWWDLFKAEIGALFANPAVVMTVFVGVVVYSFLYPLPYRQQVPREQPVLVVNHDDSALSRELERMVDATPQVRIVGHAHTEDEARRRFLNGDLAGLLVIPDGFHRDLMLGRSPVLAYAGDASFFLVYGTVIEGLATAGGTLGAEIKVARLLAGGQALPLAVNQHTPLSVNLRPVFNPTMGYVHYVVPAVFVLILHQTLLIGLGLLGGGQRENDRAGLDGYWRHVPAGMLLTARLALFLIIYILLMAYYFGFCFEMYGISRLASITDLLTVAVPFLLAAGCLGVVIGQLIPRRELATLVVLLSSLPLVFAAGFVWPVSALPGPVNAAAQLSPSTPGIQAFLRLNQMGADFVQIRGLWLQMWIQAAGYGGLAWWLLRRGTARQLDSVRSDR